MKIRQKEITEVYSSAFSFKIDNNGNNEIVSRYKCDM